jgi:hypothetical protein
MSFFPGPSQIVPQFDPLDLVVTSETRQENEEKVRRMFVRTGDPLIQNLGTRKSTASLDLAIIDRIVRSMQSRDLAERADAFEVMASITRRIHDEPRRYERLRETLAHHCVERVNKVLDDGRRLKCQPQVHVSLKQVTPMEVWIANKCHREDLRLDTRKQEDEFALFMRLNGFSDRDRRGETGFDWLSSNLEEQAKSLDDQSLSMRPRRLARTGNDELIDDLIDLVDRREQRETQDNRKDEQTVEIERELTNGRRRQIETRTYLEALNFLKEPETKEDRNSPVTVNRDELTSPIDYEALARSYWNDKLLKTPLESRPQTFRPDNDRVRDESVLSTSSVEIVFDELLAPPDTTSDEIQPRVVECKVDDEVTSDRNRPDPGQGQDEDPDKQGGKELDRKREV